MPAHSNMGQYRLTDIQVFPVKILIKRYAAPLIRLNMGRQPSHQNSSGFSIRR